MVKLRVAVDVQIAREADLWLSRAGFFVLVRAAPREPDEQWFARALSAQVDVIVTLDKQVKRWARQAGIEVVSWTQGLSGMDLTAEIVHYLAGIYSRHQVLEEAEAG